MKTKSLLVVALIVAALPGSTSAQSEREPAQVTGTGMVERLVAPDRAVIYFDAHAYGFELSDAVDTLRTIAVQLNTDLREVADFLEVVPAGFKAAPNPQQPRNFNPQASAMKTNQDQAAVYSYLVQVDDLSRLDDALSAIARSRVRQIGAVVYERSDAEALERELYPEAVEIARLEAEAIARGLGGSVGRLIWVGPNGNNYNPFQNRVTQLMGYSGQQLLAPPQEIRVRASVTARWEFIPN